MQKTWLFVVLCAGAAVACSKKTEKTEKPAGAAAEAPPPAAKAGACPQGYKQALTLPVCVKLGADCTLKKVSDDGIQWNCTGSNSGGTVDYKQYTELDECVKGLSDATSKPELKRTLDQKGDFSAGGGKWISFRNDASVGAFGCLKSPSGSGVYEINSDPTNGGGGAANVETVKSAVALAK